MIEYLQKFMLGSLMLYSIYYLFLRNEKTFRFNRFYLLLIIPMSLTIPLITVQTSYVEVPIATPQTYIETPQEEVLFSIPMESYTTEEEPVISKVDWNQILLYSYFSICILLLLRFTLNLYRLNNFKKQGHLIQKQNYQLCLQDDLKSSFTFLNTIYTNKPKYLANLLPSTILEHEKAHVLQKHSYDIILMELLNTALWFNPVIYLIKHSIKLNHEFLADEAVYQSSTSLPDYQKTLINYTKLNSNNEPLLASRLTFGETKKRLKMMVKTTHKSTALMKQSIGLIAIAATILVLGNHKIIAQQQSEEQLYEEYKARTEYRLFNGKDSILYIYRGPFPKNDELVRIQNKDQTITEKEFGRLNHKERMRFPDHTAKTQFFDKDKNSWRNIGGIERVITLNKSSENVGSNNRRKSDSKDSMHIGKKVIPLVSLSPDTKVRYKNENGKVIESEFGKLSREQKVLFASPEGKGEVWTNSFFDSTIKWRSYMELLNWARRTNKNKIPSFFGGENGTQSPQDTLPKKSNLFAPSPNRMVRFISTEGDTIKKLYKNLSDSELERFKQNEAEPAYFAPPPPKGIIPDNFVETFSDPNIYGVWVDGERVPNSNLKNYNKDDFHHFTKSRLLPNAKNYGKHQFQINFVTNNKHLNKGVWIRILNIAKSEKSTDNLTDYDPQSQMPFIGFDTTKVEHFRVPTPRTHVKFIDINKRLVVQEWKNLTDAQKMQWFTKDQEGMIFSPPSAKTKIDYIVLNEIIEDKESEIILNGQNVEASSLNGIYPFEIHDFSKAEDKDGKTTYNLTTNEVFLTEEYLETHWISNVIYKKSNK